MSLYKNISSNDITADLFGVGHVHAPSGAVTEIPASVADAINNMSYPNKPLVLFQKAEAEAPVPAEKPEKLKKFKTPPVAPIAPVEEVFEPETIEETPEETFTVEV